MLWLAVAHASELPPEARLEEVRPSPAPDTGLKFFGLAQTRLVASDIATVNPLVNGQIVGRLGGTNSTTTADETGVAAEQRVGGFFTYTPDLLDGRASLEAAFEVDYAWGDSSYNVGGNTGGGIGADQVNLQTRRLAMRIAPYRGGKVVAGLQFVGDGVHDPGASKLDDLTRSGGRLMLWGTEMAGVTLYGKARGQEWDWLRYKVGGYTLYEQGLASPDDVTLWMAGAQLAPAYATRVGIQGFWLKDRAGGQGGFFGTGVTSALAELQGAARLDLREDEDGVAPEVSADVAWVLVDGGYDPGLDHGRVGLSGVFGTNVGRLYVTELQDVPVFGWFGAAEARVRWAEGEGSVVRLEGVVASGEDDDDDTYTGVVTGNSYGVVGAVYSSHGCLLLFPDAGAINRQTSVVYDLSNTGRGLVGVSATAAWDAVPNRLTVAVGGGHARDMYGDPWGTEVNARVVGRPWTLATLGLYGARVVGTPLETDPWTAFVAFDWLVI